MSQFSGWLIDLVTTPSTHCPPPSSTPNYRENGGIVLVKWFSGPFIVSPMFELHACVNTWAIDTWFIKINFSNTMKSLLLIFISTTVIMGVNSRWHFRWTASLALCLAPSTQPAWFCAFPWLLGFQLDAIRIFSLQGKTFSLHRLTRAHHRLVESD